MDAELFCLTEHVESAGRLLRQLNTVVDPTITLKVLDAETASWPEREEIGRRYTKLLHASIPPERKLGVEAVTGLELFGNRVYLRFYWPMLVEGWYWYPGVDGLVRGLYWSVYERQFHARGRGLELFLPALALRDRMVMVPRGQNETLEDMGTPEPDRPPLQRGVLEADFGDPADVERALTTIGQELRRELRKELVAYRSFHPSDDLDLDAVSAHLGVNPMLLRRAVDEEADARALVERQLVCTLAPATVVRDVQTRIALRVENSSTVGLGRTRVQVRGPSSGLEVNPERLEMDLPAGGTASADLSVAATRVGEFVVEVVFLDAETGRARDLVPAQQLWLTSVAP